GLPPYGFVRLALGLGEVEAFAVVLDGLAPLQHGLAALGQLLGGAVAEVGPARLQELLGVLPVDLQPLRLPVRPIGAAHLGPLVPVEAQPAQAVENGCEGLLGGALGVGVLNAEDEGAAVVAGKEPVEERRASPTHVQVAGGTGRKTGPNLCQ